MDNVIYNRYRELACTSIFYAINEYLKAENNDTEDDLFIKWVYDCEWFDLLPLNRELVIKGVMNLKREGVKSIYYVDAWKGYKVRTKWQNEE